MRSNGTLGYGDNSVSVQLDASQPIAVTLAAAYWQRVLGMIAQGPWIEADPLIGEIRRQIAIAVAPPSAAAEQAQDGPSVDR
jgi:hypothetical protein